MSTQSEAILEENLLKQIEFQEYERVIISDDKVLKSTLIEDFCVKIEYENIKEI